MKKILSFFLFTILCTPLFAQLDREHWFAPMIDRTGNPNPYQTLYLSTNRTATFPVTIYNNNTVIGTVNISKNNPQKFDVLRNYIITTLQTDLFTPTTKGLYLKADFPFYANLRFSVFNHGEIITSKGIPSTGNIFHAANAPITVSNGILNFMTSILATEDNTTVTVSGYKNTVQFSNGTTGATNPTLSFTLNKGQSYIIDGNGSISGNWDGFIGAKIQSNKPINVTNGNFNGQYAGNILQSSDILMDQSVPVNRLGSEFALVKGNGSIGSNMEGALIIATEDNTQIYVNNETLPLATLNIGQYFKVPDSKYILQGSGHYNLYLKTTKNAYVYQILAGNSSPTDEVATGGFNFIPALNCYLPKQINELGFINENFVHTNNNPSGILNIPTKLNLITEKGAVVTVNGVIPPASTGPFNMTGTSNWVTYGIPNVTGTITILSSKAITAGINAGSDAVGYGGFFAGFPTQPVILKTGTCAPNATLTVDPIIYDTYQWYLNGNLIPGATGTSYSPTQSGNYSVSVTMGSCAPLVSSIVPLQNCPVSSTQTHSICSVKTFTPQFTTSIQTPVASTVSIVNAPTLGTAAVNPTTGLITYTVTSPGTLGTDTFSYTFCGNNASFPDCETVTVQISIPSFSVNNATINTCTTVVGQGNFDLTQANITTSSNTTITYYPTLLDAQNENPAAQINNINNYPASNGTIVYAVVQNNSGCKGIALITLNLYPQAGVNSLNMIALCDENLDGIVDVLLSDITLIAVNNPTYFTNVRYYTTLADATLGGNNNLPNNWSYITNTTLYIRVDSPDGCPAVIDNLNFTIGGKISLLTDNSTTSYCDDDTDGVKQLNLSIFIPQFTVDPGVSVTFHGSLADANNDVAPLNNPISINGTQTLYLRFEKPSFCPAVASLTITIKIPKKSDILVNQIICPNTTTLLDAGSGFSSYNWSTGANTQTINNVSQGNYWVDLTFDGCTYRQFVTVAEASLPVITNIDINGSTVTVTATGGTAPYEYSIDGFTWQTSNVFHDVYTGNYIMYVRDAKRCEVVQQTFVMINLINTITPNDDGSNDVINYSALSDKENLEFRIFDRYGAEQFRGTPQNNYTWDGKMKGRHVPTATYWYFISWTEGKVITVKYTSWLLVKNRYSNIYER